MSEVDKAMETIGVKTVREFASMCRVSEKTVTGWKKKLPPLGKAIVELYLENHTLKLELKKMQKIRSALREILE